jgi:hypothetical protein
MWRFKAEETAWQVEKNFDKTIHRDRVKRLGNFFLKNREKYLDNGEMSRS